MNGSREFWAIVAVGATLLGTTLWSNARLEARLAERMDRMETRLTERIDGVDARLRGVEVALGRLDTRVMFLETRFDKLEPALDLLGSEPG